MSEAFDPYYKWLAIPPEEQPPDHYRLLGVKRFEPDADVIEAAADQRMIHLRNYQSGKQAAHSQKLLNEVAAAKVTLLLPEKRASYDEQLRRTLHERPLPPAAPAGSAAPPLPVAVPLQAPPVAPIPPQRSPSGHDGPAPVTQPSAFGKPSAMSAASATPTMARRRKPSSSLLLPTLIAGGATGGILLLLLCAGGLYFLFSGGGDDPDEIVKNNPARVVRPSSDGRGRVDGNPTKSVGGRVDGGQTDGGNADAGKTDGEATDGGTSDGGTSDGGTSDGGNSDGTPPNGGTSDGTPPGPMPDPKDPMTPADPPDPKPVDPPPEPPPVDPPPEEPKPPKKPAPPSSEDQQKLLAQVDSVLKLDEAETNEQKLDKYREMLAMAHKPGSNDDERFVLLRRAMEVARDVGDPTLTMRAIDDMNDAFDIDVATIRGAMLAGLAATAQSEESIRALLQHSETFIDKAIREDRADLALGLAEELFKKVPNSSVPGRFYRKELKDRRDEVKELYSAWQVVQDARKKLETNPDDAAANLAVGQYLSLTKGEFDAGIDHLAKSGDAALADAVKKDLAAQEGDDAAKLAAADAWWDAVEDGKQDVRYLARAHHWYSEVSGGQIGALAQKGVEERLEAISKVESAQKLIEAISAGAAGGIPTRVVVKDPLPLKAAASGDVAIEFSPDSKTLYAAGSDGLIKLWNISQGRSEQTWAGHNGRINDIAVSPDGVLVSVGSDRMVYVWNQRGEHAALAKGDRGDYRAVAFSKDGKLAVGRSDGITFLDFRRKQVLSQLPVSNVYFESLFFTPDGNGMAAMGNRKLLLWGSNGTPLSLLSAQDGCTSAAFSPDGRLLAIAPNNSKVQLYDLALKTPREIDTDTYVTSLAFSPDGKTLATGRNTTLQLFDVASGQRWCSVETLYIRDMKFSPDGKIVAVAGNNGSVQLWHVERERILEPPPTAADLAGSDAAGANWVLRGTLTCETIADCAFFSPDGKVLAFADGPSVRSIDALYGAPRATLIGHQSYVHTLGWSPDGTQLVTGSDDNSTRLWEAETGKEIGRFDGSSNIRTVGFSADGRKLVSIDGARIRIATVPAMSATQMDLPAGRRPSSFTASSVGGPFAAVVEPFGNARLRVYDFITNGSIAALDASAVLAVSHDGKRLLAYSNSSDMRVFDIATKKQLAGFHTSGSIRAAAFHPGGKMVAVGGYENTISLWSIETSKLIAELSGHTGNISSLDFSADGKSLASASGDKTVKIWSPKKP